MAKKKVSADYIQSLRKHLENKYRKRNKVIEGVRIRRFQEKEPVIPKAYQKSGVEFRSPLVGDFVRRSASLMGTAMPVASVVPIKLGVKAQENSSKREQWFNEGAYRRMQQDNPVYAKLKDALASDGLAVWKVLPERYRWGEIVRGDEESDYEWVLRYEETKKARFPFRWEYVDATTFYPVYDEDGLSEVLEVTRRETLPLIKKYKLRLTDSGGFGRGQKIGSAVGLNEYPDTVVFVEYWSRNDFAYVIDDVVVGGGEHKCGRPPYFIATATETSSNEPSQMNQPLAAPLVRLQDSVDALGTIGLNWVYMSGFPQPTLEPMSPESSDAETGDVELVLEPGKLLIPPPGWKFGYTGPPPASAEISAMRDFLMDMADKVSLAPILSGLFGSSGSGVAANTMIAVAKSIFGPALDSLARGFDDTAAFIQYYIDKIIKDDVPVFASVTGGKVGEWISLGPDDIQGYYEVRHKLEPTIPAEKQAQGIFLADAQARGAISMQRYQEEGLGIHNPELETKQILIEDLRKAPEIRSLLVQQVIQALDLAAPSENPPQGEGTPEGLPIGPGGPGQTMVRGVQQGMGDATGGQPPMAARPEDMAVGGLPPAMGGIPGVP